MEDEDSSEDLMQLVKFSFLYFEFDQLLMLFTVIPHKPYLLSCLRRQKQGFVDHGIEVGAVSIDERVEVTFFFAEDVI